jgi:hypothetical protein
MINQYFKLQASSPLHCVSCDASAFANHRAHRFALVIRRQSPVTLASPFHHTPSPRRVCSQDSPTTIVIVDRRGRSSIGCRWRRIACDWYAQVDAEYPGRGKLHHHLGLLSHEAESGWFIVVVSVDVTWLGPSLLVDDSLATERSDRLVHERKGRLDVHVRHAVNLNLGYIEEQLPDGEACV